MQLIAVPLSVSPLCLALHTLTKEKVVNSTSSALWLSRKKKRKEETTGCGIARSFRSHVSRNEKEPEKESVGGFCALKLHVRLCGTDENNLESTRNNKCIVRIPS